MKAVRILIDYTSNGVRAPREVIAHEFEIEGAGEHRFAVHNSLDPYPIFVFVTTHIQTGFCVSKSDDIDDAIERARKNWTTCNPEALALKLIRAKNQTCVTKRATPTAETVKGEA